MSFGCLIILTFTACNAQIAKLISVEKIYSGNSGYRGHVVSEDMGKLNTGVEYLDFEMRALNKGRIDSMFIVFPATNKREKLNAEQFPKNIEKNAPLVFRAENLSSQYTDNNGALHDHQSVIIETYARGKKEATPFNKIVRILSK